MRARLLAIVTAATTCGALLSSRSAAAQDVPGATVAPQPPKIIKYVEPDYPPARLAKGEKAEVVVELTIDDAGNVTDATVTTPAGDDFDAAAIAAAKQLRFSPATKDGKPIKAKIPFRFKFDFKEVEPPKVDPKVDAATVPPKPVVVIRGTVRTPAEDGVVGARVTATATDGTSVTVQTDANGRFELLSLPEGKYRVRVESEGFVPFDAEESVKTGEVSEVIYRPTLATTGADIIVKGEKPPREITKRTIDQREITRIPGTNGDALRSIQTLPGVGRPPGLFGILLIRGSAPQDTNVFIDGTLIPLVYHFGGITSVIPSELVDHIDFYPGNFGPEYGRVMGGIIDVGIKSPRKEGYGALMQLDLIDARTVIEGAIDDKTRFIVAGRRSWVDVWLKPALEKAGSGVSTAPRYYDYQLELERDLTKSTTGRLLFIGSDDRLVITLNSPSASDPTFGGDISSRTGFWRLQARTDTAITKDVHWLNTLAYGADLIDFAVGDYFFDLTTHPLAYRSDLRAKLSSEAAVVVGLDALWATFDVGLKFPPPPLPGETPGPFFARPAPELHASGSIYRPGVYGMLELSPIKALKLLPGVRVDFTHDISGDGHTTVSPRFGARYDVVAGFPRTTLKGAAGVFYQPAQPNESIPPFGTPGLKNNRATHYDLGFEQEFTRALSLSMEGFFKDLQELIVRQNTATTTASGIAYGNTGSGRVYGLEAWLRYKHDGPFFGWISYTLSKSERRDQPGAPLRNFAFDETHILTVLGSYDLGRNWSLGARFRYVSGYMYTPNVGGISDFDAGAYQAIPTYPPFNSRLPSFNQLDIRVDKAWQFSHWRLSAYLDVWNVYNRKNPEGVTYNYNYSKSDVISFLPIIPNLGVRGEL